MEKESINITDKFPDLIMKIFEEKGVPRNDVLLTLKSDINYENVYSDVYIAVTKEDLYILSGIETSKRTRNKVDSEFTVLDFTYYPLKDVSDFKVEELLSNGRVVAKQNNEYKTLFNFTFAVKSNVYDFVGYIGQIKEKGSFETKKDKRESPVCPKCGNYYPDAERKICPQCMDKGKLFSRLFIFIKKYKFSLFVSLAALIVSTGISVLTGFINGIGLYDMVLSEDGSLYGKIGLLVLSVISVDVVSRLIMMVFNIITSRIAAMVIYDLKRTIFETFQKLSMSFFSSRQTGGLMTQLNRDAQQIFFFLCDGAPYFIMNVTKIIATTIIMLCVNPVLTLAVYVTVPVFMIFFRVILKFLEVMYARHFSRSRAMNAVLSDVLNGMRVVKAFSKEADETERFTDKSEKFTDINKKVSYSETTLFPSTFFIMNIGYYLVMLIGGWYVVQNYNGFTYGMLMTFVAFLDFIFGPLDFFVFVPRWFAHTINSVQRLFEIYDAVPEVAESENPVKIGNVQGKVEFDNVHFSYVKNRKTIDSVSFTVEAGKVLGIVGHTGAGKSTLANLLIRLYDPEEGSIKIDDINIKDLSFSDLHSMISIVSQETYMFGGTIADNIRYAKPDATNEEIMTAAKIASAHDFITKLPESYETRVGRGYKDLSGGEKQRISIARAVLRNSKILIMDEATASMDTETERQIQTALENLSKDRTTIIIAHRLSTLRNADKLIVVENGKMTESGTHIELINKKGTYYNLYSMQAKALKTIGIDA